MLVLKILKFYGKILNFGSRFGFIPYTWNDTSNRMEFNNSKKRYRYILFQLILLLIYEVFVVIRCGQTILGNDKTMPQKVKLVYMTCVYLVLNVNHLVIFNNYGVHHKLFQTLVDITMELQDGFLKQRSKNDGKGLTRILKFLVTGISFACLTNSASTFTHSDAPRLFTSILSKKPKTLPFWVKFSLGCVHMFSNSFQYYMMTYNVSTIFCCMYGIAPIIDTLKYHDEIKEHNGVPKQKFLYHVASLFNKLAVFQSHFNGVYGLWTLGMTGFATGATILNIFQAVVYDSIRSFMVCIVLVFCLLYALKELSQVHEESVSAQATWTVIRSSKWFLKFQKSCRSLRSEIGSFGYADKSVILSILTFIINNSVNVVLTYRYD